MRWREVPYLKEFALILFFFMLTQGLAIVNDGIYFDEWIYLRWVETRNWAAMYENFKSQGLPVWTFLHWSAGLSFPDPVFSNKIFLGSGLLSGVFSVFFMARRWLQPKYATLIGIIMCTYPAAVIWMDQSQLPYVFFYGWFLLTGCAITGLDPQIPGSKRLPVPLLLFLRLFSLAAFVAFFSVGSLICLMGPWVLYWYLLYIFKNGYTRSLRLFWAMTARFVLYRLDYLLLPFVYWKLTKIYFPPYGDFKGYNEILPKTWDILDCVRIFWNVAVVKVLQNISTLKWLRGFGSQPYLSTSTVVAMILSTAYLTARKKDAPERISRLRWGLVLVFGGILFFFGVLGYSAVNKYPVLWGWRTRYSLIVSLPVGVMLTAVLGILETFPYLKMASRLSIGLLVAGFTYTSQSGYLIWQARWMRDRAIIDQLKTIPVATKYSVLVVVDETGIAEEGLRIYEWAGLFRKALGPGHAPLVGYTQEAIDEYYGLFRDMPNFKEKFMLDGFDPHGAHGYLAVRKLYQEDERALALKYLGYRIIFRDDLARELADGMVRVEITDTLPLPRSNSGST